ncbi:MAG: glycosyltransferase family 4 protein [Bacteroidetes bacterium]|nr:glycosyltransferase family 4 protein [Bacteroidota bacterium]
MKICFITEYFPTGSMCDIRGGAEAVAFYEAKYLSVNHAVEVITSFESGSKREDLIGNIRVFRCGKARDYAHKNAFADRFLFMRSAYLFGRRQKYDLIVGFSIITYPVAWKISKKLRVPCIIRYHDVLVGKWIRNFGINGLIGEILEKYTLSRKFAAIIAVSDYTAGNLQRYFRETEKIHVVHNGVEIPVTSRAKAEFPTIVCVSRLVKYKHVDDLVNAIALLLKDFPDLQCEIIGTGPEEKKLKRLAMQRGINEHVTFSGFVPDHGKLMEMIRSSHVFCLPSSLEGFGIAILESMACGVPFVAADIPALAEVSDKKGGLFFQCRNVEDLAEKTGMILKDSQLQNKLSIEGRRRANEFLWTDLSKKTETIYEKTVGEWSYPKAG